MAKTHILRDLMKQLSKDELRPSVPFSTEVAQTNDVLWNGHLESEEKQAMLANWLQRHQTCMFGRIAASKGWLHFCVLDEADLRKSDQSISHKIQAEVLAWKRRSIRPRADISTPAHGFMLVVASNWIANATPDKHLRRVAAKILNLWGCPVTKEPAGKVYWESLFLENPVDRTVTKFEFSIDFFAAQGDGRWWRDHRIPGGIAFTANSVGHMMRYQEQYEGAADQTLWGLWTAIDTIKRAEESKGIKATWLRDTTHNGPFEVAVPCPFPDAFATDAKLKGVDWTRYEGYLHTDHSIRPEFFYPGADLPPAVASKRYVLDFAYLYNKETRDYRTFVSGVPIQWDEVEKEIGNESDWVIIRRQPKIRARGPVVGPRKLSLSRTQQKELERIRQVVKKSRRWRMSARDVRLALEGLE